MSLSLSLVDMVAARAAAEGAQRVIRVGVEVGALGHVEPQALAFCLESAARGTLLEGTRFEIDTPDGRAWCFDCAAEVPVASRAEPCPRCGGHALRLSQGEELKVTEMEIA
jgi:hydrogenase nickel incorporation protein HypA/HybF